MNQANVEKLVSKLKYHVKPRRKLRNLDGPEGRLRKIQKTVTALIKYERIELNYPRADESRGYAERVCVSSSIIINNFRFRI
jgi:large subunit ribosomal protein L17